MPLHKFTESGAAVPADVGPSFRVIRITCNIGLRELARATVDAQGKSLDHSHLARFEQGKVGVSMDTYLHLCRALGSTIANRPTEDTP
jgi:hypothetical protein